MRGVLRKLIPEIVINKYHYLLAMSGAIFFRFPSRKLKVIGVTGTNGKSTVVYLLAKMLTAAGYKVASSSSIEFQIGDKVWPNEFKMTMPGRAFLQSFLAKAVKAGCTHVVIEVTSEGLVQNRHAFVDFDTAIFTNLSPEHIERHGGYVKYREAKGVLFRALAKSNKKIKTSIINLADPKAQYFLSFGADRIFVYRKHDQEPRAAIPQAAQEVISQNEQVNASGIDFNIATTKYQSSLRGDLNIENMLAVISAGISEGLSLDSMAKILQEIKEIPGRLEQIPNKKGINVFVDYAHTPAALESVYQALGANSVLICVLGAAGGGRDKWKRPEMGKIAVRYCQKIILTNEDPYDEDPVKIIAEIEAGLKESNFKKENYEIMIDRKAAIVKAISIARSGETVIITGKGSESLMAVAAGKKISWDDRQIAVKALREADK
ncbi:MAG: hypothetical protein A3A80_02140 [Candidatus Terrybacteria bacterium RIFCSPLOWO2_01_FULL_44_24]|uniref:UDP-N-acetylmuramyl-tripeptide synthetase n=1 Tax=Candidatus Terrybacteria bacterium RIFCSPHIGHO2_01_FULL_43_35 TaxID=1802361 RepID=A0A1G2PGC5_9BACT|nr:MAG: hypothetical protein A2828_01930 [Candidatus Terrybacteria bacterium RIFCSPHIGHO2_01_FULL_43_35]OHA50880.1 MAG: hypothetical protein A3A80_02140 [Candidatus Terrybacteria bacterium RIFCSPLOWO2_01_FULL_44_24]